jgi:tRNA(Arg) A34 adenosine deaminase TadA
VATGPFETGVSLGLPWQTCLSLCLDALQAGSLGIAAVVTDSSGSVISQGRNQLFDSDDSPNAIKNTTVSHAEVNAIAGLPEDRRRDKSIVLYTTVEPCPMCLGAIAMSPIRKVVIASRDPYAGAASLAEMHPWMKRKNIEFNFESGRVENLFASLHVYSLLQRRDLPLDHPFYASIEEHYPQIHHNMVARRDDGELAEAIRLHDTGRVIEICSG